MDEEERDIDYTVDAASSNDTVYKMRNEMKRNRGGCNNTEETEF